MSDARDQWRAALAPTPQCIPLERLGEARTDAEREHLASCARCQTEVALFAEMNAMDASADSRWVAEELHRRFETNVKPFSPRRNARFAWAAAAAIAIAIAGGVWMETREPSIGGVESTNVYRALSVEAIAPVGDLAEAPRELRWKPVAGATGYAVELREVDRTLLWRSETSASVLALPADVVAQCAPGKSLLWDVAARRGSDVLASSGVQRFRVAVQVPRRNVP
ncbi:MAG: hypothetical protein JOZ54_21245 [Acidobacteria bacterium]|nr:hypothetical protein [Acidobacteriota bacterium]